MRILICNWKDPMHPAAGGAEVYTWEIARRWSEWGHEMTLFAGAVAGRPLEERIDGIRVVRAGGKFTVYGAARRFLRSSRGRFDLVLDEVNTRPFFAARHTDAPVVALIHQIADDVWGYEMPWPVALIGRHVLEPRWLAAYRDVPAVTPSRSSVESLHEHGLRKVSLVPIGVTLPNPMPLQPPKESEPTLVFLGRLTAAKRPQHAIEAVRVLRRSLPEARLWIVGTGPLERRLRQEAPDWVEFHGWVGEEHKFELLARAHAILVTSVREGWGLIVDEAAASGTPAFAYDVPGLRDSVPAAGGTLTDPEPAALAAALAAHLPALAIPSRVAGWRGGAVGWDEAAARVLAEVTRLAGVQESARDLSGGLAGGAGP